MKAEFATRIARVLKRLRRGESGFTLVECLMVVSITGAIVASLSMGFLTSGKVARESETRLDESGDTRLVTAYFVPDVESASYFSTSAPSSPNTCDPGNNRAVFEWTEAPAVGLAVRKAAYYHMVGTTELRRRYCENSVRVGKDVPIATHLSPDIRPTASCPLDAVCTTKPSAVELTVVEASGYTFNVRSTPRAAMPSGTGGMHGLAAYIGGGGMNLQSNFTQIHAGDGIMVSVQDPSCNNGNGTNITPAGSLYSSVGGGGECGDAKADPPADPLTGFPEMTTAPVNVVTSSTMTALCGASMATWDAGRYTGNRTLEGCLKPGAYWFDGDLVLKNARSVTDERNRGVHLFVRGAVSFEGTTELWPMTSGPQAGVTIFMSRGFSEQISVDKVSPIVHGIIYAPTGSLVVKGGGQGETVLSAGAINVNGVSLESNGKIKLGI